jgi:uncharacterized protein with GYD domain
MAHYLVQVAYTPQAWAALVKNPQDRTKVLRPVVEKLGGTFEKAFFAFGEYDIVAVMEMPANTEAAAFAVAAAAGGSIKSIKTTPLMTIEEGIAAMKKAATLAYVPPGAPVAGV